MLDAVKDLVSDVKTHLSEGMTIDNHLLYLNENHIDWWLANCRETYGKDRTLPALTATRTVFLTLLSRLSGSHMRVGLAGCLWMFLAISSL